MKKMFIYCIVTMLLMVSCNRTIAVEEVNESIQAESINEPFPAKNIIFLIGDGMGLTQITSGMIENNMTLNLERMKVIGLSKTNSSAEIITDSAAGATAFSTGVKTYNGAIGVDENKQPKETILETLGKEGYATGLIATCAITHATPASFYAHQESRKMGYEIAADMVNSPLDLFIGGGKKHFVNRTLEDEGQPDDRDIIKELEQKGFTFITDLSQLENANTKVGYFLADGHPKSILEGRDDILPRSVKPSINYLQNKSNQGFFIMIEGSQIDWGGHANDSDYIVTEMIDFDKAVGEALDFAEKDGNTLVIVTADHETGGYALRSIDGDYKTIEGSFSTGGHTGVMVPVFAYGPGAENFQGIYPNNHIYNKLFNALNR